MLTVEVADKAGACFGVARALELARAAADSGGTVHTLGPLIHNPRVVAELERGGVGVAATLDDAGEGTLVLRSHGTAPHVAAEAAARGFSVVDATCPYVAKVQRRARELGEAGYGVVIVGEAGHAEVESIRAWGGRAVVAVAAEPDELPDELPGRVGVVVQTTQSRECVERVVAALEKRCAEVRVEQTVCRATQQRQQAACDLAARVQVMLVVGGRNSGNTRRLFELCRPLCASTHHVEDAAELDCAWFAGVSRVGVTGGASTPADQISAVVERLRAL